MHGRCDSPLPPCDITLMTRKYKIHQNHLIPVKHGVRSMVPCMGGRMPLSHSVESWYRSVSAQRAINQSLPSSSLYQAEAHAAGMAAHPWIRAVIMSTHTTSYSASTNNCLAGDLCGTMWLMWPLVAPPEGLHHGEIPALETCAECMAQQDRAMSG